MTSKSTRFLAVAIKCATVFLNMGCRIVEKDPSGFLRLRHPQIAHRVYVLPCKEMDPSGAVLYHIVRRLLRPGVNLAEIIAHSAWHITKSWWRTNNIFCVVQYSATATARPFTSPLTRNTGT